MIQVETEQVYHEKMIADGFGNVRESIFVYSYQAQGKRR